MSNEAANLAYAAIDEENAGESAATRRKFVAGAAATLGGMGLLGFSPAALARVKANEPQTILNIAATAEVLATIVNTVGPEKVNLQDRATRNNVRAAAREELIHYDVLVSSGIGAKPLTKKIWVPDAVFASRKNLLETLVVGDQIFINAYMIGTTVFGDAGNGRLARVTSEFMGAEAVHRALARQSLGLLGNDRVFMKYDQTERAAGPGRGMRGFTDIMVAVKQLQAAGIGFGAEGSKPGRFYHFDSVRKRTPNPSAVNTRTPR